MKVYKDSCHIFSRQSYDTDGSDFHKDIVEAIKRMQKKGLEIEIHYNTSIIEWDNGFGALVLGYVEE